MIALRIMQSLLVMMAAGAAISWLVSATRRRWARPSARDVCTWMLAGVAAAYVISLGSWLGALALATLFVVASRGRQGDAAADIHLTAPRNNPLLYALWALLLVVVAWSVLRPQLPLTWDEFVWIGKAQIEGRDGFGALTAAALKPGQEVFPAGYPLLWSLLPAWLVRSGALADLAVGFSVAKLLCVFAFAFSLRAHCKTAELPPGGKAAALFGAAGALALAAPLFVAHLKLMYADAPVGLLAATLTLTLLPAWQAGTARRSHSLQLVPAVRACIIAILLCGFKDEGAGHVAAIAFAALVCGDRSMRKPAAAALAAATVVALTWRLTLANHGISNADHSLETPVLSQWYALAQELARDASDPLTWGILWPLVALACGYLLFARAPDRQNCHISICRARFVAMAWLAQTLTLIGALLVGPPRVRIFALNGTLFNRMLIQLTPSAALVLFMVVTRLLARTRATHASRVAEPAPTVMLT